MQTSDVTVVPTDGDVGERVTPTADVATTASAVLAFAGLVAFTHARASVHPTADNPWAHAGVLSYVPAVLFAAAVAQVVYGLVCVTVTGVITRDRALFGVFAIVSGMLSLTVEGRWSLLPQSMCTSVNYAMGTPVVVTMCRSVCVVLCTAAIAHHPLTSSRRAIMCLFVIGWVVRGTARVFGCACARVDSSACTLGPDQFPMARVLVFLDACQYVANTSVVGLFSAESLVRAVRGQPGAHVHAHVHDDADADVTAQDSTLSSSASTET